MIQHLVDRFIVRIQNNNFMLKINYEKELKLAIIDWGNRKK